MPGTNLPRTLRKLVATQFSPKFRDVVAIAEDPMPQPGDGEILIKNRQVKKKKLCKKKKSKHLHTGPSEWGQGYVDFFIDDLFRMPLNS